MSGRTVGHCACPYCQKKAAELKHDKNGHPYLVCFDCVPPSQHFTRGDPARVRNLLGEGGAKVVFLPGVELPAWAKPPVAPAPAPKSAPKPVDKPAERKRGSMMDTE